MEKPERGDRKVETGNLTTEDKGRTVESRWKN